MTSKEQKKKNIREWKQKEREKFLKTLPFSEEKFNELFDYLDAELEKTKCKNDYTLSKMFLEKNSIDFENCIDFFIQNGGGCDCEILMNIEELFPDNESVDVSELKTNEKREKLNKLILSDFVIEQIPKPWKLYNQNEKYVFQLGKKSEINVSLIQSLGEENWKNEDFWKEQWITLTELDYKLGFEIHYEKLGDYQMVIVKSINWVPVIMWIKPIYKYNWWLVFRTESQRFKGNLNDLKKLLENINECTSNTSG